MSDTTAQQVDDIAWVVDAMAHVRPTVVGGRYHGSAVELSTTLLDMQQRLAALEAAATPPDAPPAAQLVPHTHSVSATTGAATATPTTTP